ncbi:hypothetical protein OSB04_020653 [Centaurea solstitialis]|uniref:Uncharacterized protein n=1 Tax=Centaurea solstitialis TaxID=347529 RepID=A0AA38T4T0_9ASTR|nr:hypothetical protein OSB04_020653 [Centaurea solstitialis]
MDQDDDPPPPNHRQPPVATTPSSSYTDSRQKQPENGDSQLGSSDNFGVGKQYSSTVNDHSRRKEERKENTHRSEPAADDDVSHRPRSSEAGNVYSGVEESMESVSNVAESNVQRQSTNRVRTPAPPAQPQDPLVVVESKRRRRASGVDETVQVTTQINGLHDGSYNSPPPPPWPPPPPPPVESKRRRTTRNVGPDETDQGTSQINDLQDGYYYIPPPPPPLPPLHPRFAYESMRRGGCIIGSDRFHWDRMDQDDEPPSTNRRQPPIATTILVFFLLILILILFFFYYFFILPHIPDIIKPKSKWDSFIIFLLILAIIAGLLAQCNDVPSTPNATGHRHSSPPPPPPPVTCRKHRQETREAEDEIASLDEQMKRDRRNRHKLRHIQSSPPPPPPPPLCGGLCC